MTHNPPVSPGVREALKGRGYLQRETQPVVHIIALDEATRNAHSTVLIAAGFDIASHVGARDFLSSDGMNGPGCLVLEAQMPDMGGLNLQQELKRIGAAIPIVFTGDHADVETAVEAMKQGAADFLLNPIPAARLVRSVQDALRHDGEVRRNLRHLQRLQELYKALTPREKQVLELLVQGRANKAIATQLALSQRTVEAHRARVLEKMQAASFAQLVRMKVEMEQTLRPTSGPYESN